MRAILTYHAIDDSGSVVSVAPGRFREQMEWLARSGIRTATVGELLETPAGGDAAALTFDDGFRNFADEAWPVLRDLGIPATLFVVTGRVGGRADWDELAGNRPLLSWAELERLAGEGVELGAHGRTHRSLDELPEEEIADEVRGSAADLEARTGRVPAGFAYPSGRLSGPALAAVRGAFDWACCTVHRTLGPREDPHRLPRLDMYYFRDPGALEGWGSPSFRRRVWLRRQGRRLRRRVRSVVGGP